MEEIIQEDLPVGVDLEDSKSDHLEQNLVFLDIYYDDTRYDKVSEAQADDGPSLISDIGGQLGLWLGCSILTIVELLYCCACKMPKRCVKERGSYGACKM